MADTKFEFGIATNGGPTDPADRRGPDAGQVALRPAEATAGRPQPSFDKQYLRDHLEASGWNKQPPVPSLPAEVVARTREKYFDAYRRLTGGDLA